MWVFTTKGFLSIVQHNSMPDHFQVRSRVIDPLSALWPDHEVEVIDWADYRFRITILKAGVVPVLAEQIAAVGYTNFKNECRRDEEYQEALGEVWETMYHYQTSLELDD